MVLLLLGSFEGCWPRLGWIVLGLLIHSARISLKYAQNDQIMRAACRKITAQNSMIDLLCAPVMNKRIKKTSSRCQYHNVGL